MLLLVGWTHSFRLQLGEVSGADLSGGEDRDEGCAVADGFDVGPTALLAVDEAEDSGDDHAGFAGGFDGGDGGASSGADIVDDDDLGAGFEEAFDFAASAVGLFCFADEEAVDERGDWFWTFIAEFKFVGEFEDFIVVGKIPCAGAGGVRDEGVGTHSESAYGFSLRSVPADEVVEDKARETAAFGVESGGAAVDVVVGFLAAGEGEVAEFEGESGEEIKEGGFVISGGHGLVDFTGVPPYCLRISLF